MAFNYPQLTSLVSRIETDDYTAMDDLFKDFSNFMEENINNETVWHGVSSGRFKKKFDDWYAESFPTYKSQFSSLMTTTIESSKAREASENES